MCVYLKVGSIYFSGAYSQGGVHSSLNLYALEFIKKTVGGVIPPVIFFLRGVQISAPL